MQEQNKFCLIEKQIVVNLIGTLKNIDVRGYDSMNRLVGCVVLLENLLNGQQPNIERTVEFNSEEEG